MPILIFCLALFFSTASKSQDEGSDAIDLSSPPLQAPSKENDPDAGSILGSLTSLFPQITAGFQLPAHESICYAPQFHLGVRAFTMDIHCQLIDPHRNLIGLVALLMWSMSAFFIIMGA